MDALSQSGYILRVCACEHLDASVQSCMQQMVHAALVVSASMSLYIAQLLSIPDAGRLNAGAQR